MSPAAHIIHTWLRALKSSIFMHIYYCKKKNITIQFNSKTN